MDTGKPHPESVTQSVSPRGEEVGQFQPQLISWMYERLDIFGYMLFSSRGAAISLISNHIGLILFVAFYLRYKWVNNTHVTSYANFGSSYTPIEAGLDTEPGESGNAVVRFLSWLRWSI